MRRGRAIGVLIAAATIALTSPAAAHTWYVRASAHGHGNGSRRAPFGSLGAVEHASSPGDTIVVLVSPRDAPPLTGGIALKPRQTLIGAGPPVVGATRQSVPRIENTDPSHESGDAVELADGATVANLVIGPSYRGGIYGSDVNHVTVRGNDLSATNSSCQTGFVVQPFLLPTTAPGVAVPFSSGLPNGWAAIMIDAARPHQSVRIDRNSVHDTACADGIDIRASRDARVTAHVTRNTLTRLRQGSSQQSVLAIGMQTTGSAVLDAQLSHNTETYIGNATIGDMGFADSEGVFANSAGHSRLTEHIDHNTFAHGLGHLSANCLEAAASNGGPVMHITLADSTCTHVVGDILEAVNLSRDATMTFVANHVRAADSEFVAGPAFHQAEPGDDGDCLFELASGAASTTRVTVTDSLLTSCVTDGLEVASNVVDGHGPVNLLSFEVEHSRITSNELSNLRVAAITPIAELEGRIEHSDLGETPGTPVILENLNARGGTRARLDFGGGSLGSAGGNCIYGGPGFDVEAIEFGASARHDWWGRAGGPGPGRVLTVGGSVDSTGALARQPVGTC